MSASDSPELRTRADRSGAPDSPAVLPNIDGPSGDVVTLDGRGPATADPPASGDRPDSTAAEVTTAAAPPCLLPVETEAATDDGGPTDDRPSRALPMVAGYEIVGEVGRGGMGVVYEARQLLLNRRCALKMILAGAHADAVASLRFLAEADARLQYPNVVQIYHVGEAGGLPFFELEFVDGGSLDRRLDGIPWPARHAARLVESLATGVAEAHRLGIVHRDLKPANVLMTGDGAPKITDFGLAKVIECQSGLTATESILGSPSYMAPEQAGGHAREVGPAADVYSLGANLYELLVGRPPFRGATVLETLEQVKNAEPVSPTRLVPGTPRDLETICLKCLQKDPAKRYASAAALADDLRRFAAGEPILARPVGPVERAWRWSRRHQAVASLLAALAVVLLIGFAGMAGLWARAERNADQARANENRAHRLAETEAQARSRAEAQEALATRRAEALALEDYINRVNRAHDAIDDDNVVLAEDLLHGCPPERRGWEWHLVKRLANLERLALESPRPSVNAIAYGPDGTWLAVGSGNAFPGSLMDDESDEAGVALIDVATGEIRCRLDGLRGGLTRVSISPDGSRVAVGTGIGVEARVTLFDAASGERLWSVAEPGVRAANDIVFAPDGETMAVGFGAYDVEPGYRGQVKFFGVATGREAGSLPVAVGSVNGLAFGPGGATIAVAGHAVVELWDVAGRARIRDFRGHDRFVSRVAFSGDGLWLASGGWDRRVRIWDAATGEERHAIYDHTGFILDLAFSPDGRQLVTTSEDRSVRLWEVSSGRHLASFAGHTDFVQAVAFRPDGREIASGGMDGMVRLWDLRSSRPVVFGGHRGWVEGLAFLPDGRRVVSFPGHLRDADDRPMAWDPATGEVDPTFDRDALGGVLPGRARPGQRSAASPDGTLIASVIDPNFWQFEARRGQEYSNSTVELWEAATGRTLHTLIGHTSDVTCLAFSPDGRRLATGGTDFLVKLWDVATGREVLTLRGHTAGVVSLAFSPDGHRLVSGGIDYTARVWDATPLPADVLREHEDQYRAKREAFGRRLPAPDPSSEEADRPGLAAFHHRRGLALAEVDRPEAAIDQLREAIRLGFEPARAHADLGRALIQVGALPEAIGSLLESLRHDPGLDSTYGLLDDLLRRSGDPELAASLASQLASNEASGPSAALLKNNLAWRLVVSPDSDPGPVADAVRLARSAVAAARSNYQRGLYANTLGVALLRAGDWRGSAETLASSLELLGDGFYSHNALPLALSHWHLGDRPRALALYNRSVSWMNRHAPDDPELLGFRSEVEALIRPGRLDDAFPADPFAK